jgi:DNA-binding MarR family transcriptional regulator
VQNISIGRHTSAPSARSRQGRTAEVEGGNLVANYRVMEVRQAPRAFMSLAKSRCIFNVNTPLRLAGLRVSQRARTDERSLSRSNLIDRTASSTILEIVKLELDALRIHDANNVQAMMLFNMGDTDISVGELISRGYYLGSNVSYNVRKLSDSGYLVYERSVHDRRSIRVRLTPKGRTLRDRLSGMLDHHIKMLGQTQITDTDLEKAVAILQRLERFWMRPDAGR